MEEDNELESPIMIFGRDVRKIPCFRSSILNGVGFGCVTGLLVFMFTSKPRLASHSTVGSFTCITLSYWIYCRHEYATQKFNMGQIKGALKGYLKDDNDIDQKPEIPLYSTLEKAEIVDV